MSETRFDVYFSGQVVEGQDRAQVMQTIGKLFNASGAALEQLFSGRPVRIKSAVDQDTAVAYRVRFRDAGALVDIRPLQRQGTQDGSGQAQASDYSTEMSLLPAHSGSLIDCATEVAPAKIADISDICLSAAGEILDNTPPPAPAVIDTSGISVSPARTGSLEDCQPATNPAPAADISGLRLEQPDKNR